MRVALLIMMQFAAPAVQALLPTVPAFTRVSSPTQSLHRLPKSVAAVSVGGEDVSNQKLARNLAGAYLGAFLFGKWPSSVFPCIISRRVVDCKCSSQFLF